EDLFHFFQTLSKLIIHSPVSVFFITFQAVAIDNTNAIGLLTGSLKSLLQSFRSENQEVTSVWLDLGSPSDLQIILKQLPALLASKHVDLVYRAGEYYACQLKAQPCIFQENLVI